MAFTIRRAQIDDAAFIAWAIVTAQRGHVPRGWFDIALDRPEPQCLAFVERIATAHRQSWWHVSQFIIAEIAGEPAAALCAMPAAGTGSAGRSAIEEAAENSGLNASKLGSNTSARRLYGRLLGTGWQGRLAYRPRRVAAIASRTRIGAGTDQPCACGRKSCGLQAGVDLLFDRQRGGAAMFCEGRLRLYRGKAAFRFRGSDACGGLSPLCTEYLTLENGSRAAPTGCGNSAVCIL